MSIVFNKIKKLGITGIWAFATATAVAQGNPFVDVFLPNSAQIHALLSCSRRCPGNGCIIGVNANTIPFTVGIPLQPLVVIGFLGQRIFVCQPLLLLII